MGFFGQSTSGSFPSGSYTRGSRIELLAELVIRGNVSFFVVTSPGLASKIYAFVNTSIPGISVTQGYKIDEIVNELERRYTVVRSDVSAYIASHSWLQFTAARPSLVERLISQI